MTFSFSTIGQKLAGRSGIGDLMDDLGNALANAGPNLKNARRRTTRTNPCNKRYLAKSPPRCPRNLRRILPMTHARIRRCPLPVVLVPGTAPTHCRTLPTSQKTRSPHHPGEQFFFGHHDPNWNHRNECIRVSFAMDESTIRDGLKIIAQEVQKAFQTKP